MDDDKWISFHFVSMRANKAVKAGEACMRVLFEQTVDERLGGGWVCCGKVQEALQHNGESYSLSLPSGGSCGGRRRQQGAVATTKGAGRCGESSSLSLSAIGDELCRHTRSAWCGHSHRRGAVVEGKGSRDLCRGHGLCASLAARELTSLWIWNEASTIV
ncbi:hypothetical protein L7F22_064704 [Adiantum nelumboides]|nr:hypothetical protein [Adiantum nelumboides]